MFSKKATDGKISGFLVGFFILECSDAQIHYRAGYFVIFLDIDFRNGKVSLGHFQRGMAKDALEHYGFSAIAQVVNRKSVSETVDVRIFHSGAFRQAVNAFQKIVAAKCLPAVCCKNRAIKRLVLFLEHVPPKDLFHFWA